MTIRTERIAVADGEFDVHLALPAPATGPGIVVLQEIFGVNVYIRDACRRLAELGYVALAPALYWRTDPGLAMDEHTEEQVGRGLQAVQKLDFQAAVADSIAALEQLRGLHAAAAMAAEHDAIECHVHESAGRAFDNSFAAMFHNREAAATAWEQTRAFLERELPVT